jgi:hypothetical protein
MPNLEANILGSEVDPGWYAIHTRHQHEKNVARVLTNKGIRGIPASVHCCPPLERSRQAAVPSSLPLLRIPPQPAGTVPSQVTCIRKPATTSVTNTTTIARIIRFESIGSSLACWSSRQSDARARDSKLFQCGPQTEARRRRVALTLARANKIQAATAMGSVKFPHRQASPHFRGNSGALPPCAGWRAGG